MSRKKDLERRKPPRLRGTAALARFQGDGGSGGTQGLVPTPDTGDADKFLKGDGTWTSVSEFATPLTTRGDLIFRNSGGSDDRLALGTANQVLSSDGSDPTWSTPTMRVLATGSASGAAGIDVPLDASGYSSYTIFKLYIREGTVATDNVQMWVRLSDDGGATFEADVADYTWFDFEGGGSAATDSEIILSGGIGNAAGEGFNVELTIYNPAAAARTRIVASGMRMNTSGVAVVMCSCGSTLVSAASTDIRVLASSGNISGNWTLVGIQ
jgi:hypothetical protein